MIRLALALLVVGLVAGPVQAAITVVQTVSCAAQAATSCTTAAITSTTGNLFLAPLSSGHSSFVSVTDSKSNTYGDAVAEVSVGNLQGRMQYVAAATGGASHTFTLTLNDAVWGTLSVSEVSGAAATPLDKTASSTDASGTSHTTPSTATTAQANELLIGFGGSELTNTFTQTGTGWSALTNIAGDASTEGLIVGQRTVTATGAYAYTFTTSASVDTVQGIATWKEAAAAAGVRQRCVGCGADGKVIE